MKVSCVIPFYNEGGRVVSLLKIVTQAKGLLEIICVDDGSSDQAYAEVEKFKEVKLIRHSVNQGKAAAVLTGAEEARGEYILILDADIKRLKVLDIEKLLKILSQHPDIDLLVLRRKERKLVEFLGSDLVFAAERILKKEDLLKIMSNHPKGFEFDPAMNKYMVENNKKIAWIQGNTGNFNKIYKFGFLYGSFLDIKMFFTVIKYLGFGGYLKQRSSFLSSHLD